MIASAYDCGKGLQLVLDTMQGEYVRWLGATVGVVLVVHAQDTMPFPEDQGAIISTGRMTSVLISRVGVAPNTTHACL